MIVLDFFTLAVISTLVSLVWGCVELLWTARKLDDEYADGNKRSWYSVINDGKRRF